ncbi:MAG: hypothetical protein H0U54_11670 [Acidobacteria bacterium]|nr:hypothetical protein [Acidobacteriota bacterium]
MPVSLPKLKSNLSPRHLAGRTLKWSRYSWLDVKYFYRNHLHNGPSKQAYLKDPPLLSEPQRRVVEELATRGVSFIHFNELFREPERWNILSEAAQDFVNSENVRKSIQSYQSNYGNAAWKEYVVKLRDENPTIRWDSPWLQLSLDPPVLNIVNSYLGLWSKLIHHDMWYTIPLDADRAPIASQRWHRDPEDRHMVKVFLYFSEVDAGAGPLEYVVGSSVGGPYQNLWRHGYSPGEELEQRVASSDRLLCAGRAGTFVFCNTNGFHRGGFSAKRERVFSVSTFVTPASSSQRYFKVDWGSNQSGLSEAARFALT